VGGLAGAWIGMVEAGVFSIGFLHVEVLVLGSYRVAGLGIGRGHVFAQFLC
jgi:hypothetical protein